METPTTSIEDNDDDDNHDHYNYDYDNDNDYDESITNINSTEDNENNMASISINATIILIEDNPTPTSAYYSSNFLIIPTNNEQIDEEVRAARLIGSNLAFPLPLLTQQHDASATQQMNQEEETKIPEDNNNDRSSNSINEDNEQKRVNNNNIIAGIIGASSSGIVAMIAIGILVWHNSRRCQHQLSNNKDNTDSPKRSNERKSPLALSLPGEPMISRTATATTATLNPSHGTTIAATSYFNEWDQQQQRNIFKFPSSVAYSELFPATTKTANTVDNNSNNNGTTLNNHEEEWSSDTGSSESLSIRYLSTCDSIEENTAVTDTITSVYKQQQQQQQIKQSNLMESTLSVIHSHQSTSDSLSSHQKQLNAPVNDKNDKNGLSLVNKKLLHYPARSRHGFESSSIKNTDKENHDNAFHEIISYNLDELFYPSETIPNRSSSSSSSSSTNTTTIMSDNHQPHQHQLIRLLRHHYFVTPFDLPPSRFLPLQNCPFPLVTRQSILDDPEKRQGVHEIPE